MAAVNVAGFPTLAQTSVALVRMLIKHLPKRRRSILLALKESSSSSAEANRIQCWAREEGDADKGL
jgi:hypothetical protein